MPTSCGVLPGQTLSTSGSDEIANELVNDAASQVHVRMAQLMAGPLCYAARISAGGRAAPVTARLMLWRATGRCNTKNGPVCRTDRRSHKPAAPARAARSETFVLPCTHRSASARGRAATSRAKITVYRGLPLLAL